MSRGFRRRCSTLSNPTLVLEVEKKKEIGNRPVLPESVCNVYTTGILYFLK